MINTLNIKQAQLEKGCLTVGSGKDVMLIMGSCRVAPYVNYFNRWNEENGNRFTIHTLDAFNFNWDIKDNRVDYEKALEAWETDERMLSMLQSVDVFIHEYYQNAGMFNVDFCKGKNIYNYGIRPKIDICIPNFNDYFILFNDVVSFDSEMRKKAFQDYNVIGKLSDETKYDILDVSARNLAKFINVCHLSDIPEMADYFLQNLTTTRFFHSYNHVSKNFTYAIFEFLNEKYLHLNLSKEFMEEIFKEDMFANSYTRLTQYDVDLLQLDWGEEITDLRDKL